MCQSLNVSSISMLYSLSLHDALPICRLLWTGARRENHELAVHPCDRATRTPRQDGEPRDAGRSQDRKGTRLNSSHLVKSYAVFCLQNKNRSFSYTAIHWYTICSFTFT